MAYCAAGRGGCCCCLHLAQAHHQAPAPALETTPFHLHSHSSASALCVGQMAVSGGPAAASAFRKPRPPCDQVHQLIGALAGATGCHGSRRLALERRGTASPAMHQTRQRTCSTRWQASQVHGTPRPHTRPKRARHTHSRLSSRMVSSSTDMRPTRL